MGFVCLYNFYVWVFHLHVWLNTTCMPGVHGGLKKVLGPLELELQMIMCHVGTGN